jgi:hypothetical protein
MDNLTLWVAGASLAWNVINTIFLAVGSNKKAVDERFTHLERDINGIGRRIEGLQSELRGMPNHGNLEGIHEKINGFATVLSRLEGEFRSSTDLLRAIHSTLIQHIKEETGK